MEEEISIVATESAEKLDKKKSEEIDKVKDDEKLEGEAIENEENEKDEFIKEPADYDEETVPNEMKDEQLKEEQLEKKEQLEEVGEKKEQLEEVGEEERPKDQNEEEIKEQQVDQTAAVEEQVEEEEGYVEEPPPDPAAPLELSESKEALKLPFELRPDQTAEVEQLWEVYQNYTPAYTDIDGYITEKELVYMLKALLLMTYTAEQLQELIAYCVRPPHPEGHINYDQFLKMVTLRQRDFEVEDELRSALQVFDPDKSGTIDREYLKEVLAKQGHKMPQKQLDNLIKEVDISNDGTIGIEDVVGTMCIDLNKEDLLMLMASLNPPQPE